MRTMKSTGHKKGNEATLKVTKVHKHKPRFDDFEEEFDDLTDKNKKEQKNKGRN